MSSPAVQDYLKVIYQVTRGEAEPANTSTIAERLHVQAGSVTGMLKRMAEQGFIEHVPYYGARLTRRGRREALRTIRRHRVIELFLVEVLGYTWDRVHDEADALEHAASDELIDRLALVLGEPATDPHGDPIPGRDATIEERQYTALSDLEVGRLAVLRRVSDEDPAALRYLANLKLRPGARVEVKEHSPFNGPVRVLVDGRDEQVLGRELSSSLQVEPLDMESPDEA
ncbi:MAG: metal-dependent transcriptional regulator [Longimicrobiales bacterium]